MDWSKHKRKIWIAFAVVFLVLLFFLKTKSSYTNEAAVSTGLSSGLIYSNETIADLVNKDTNGNGVPDWEESLYGLDPTKAVSNPDGISNKAYIDKIKAAQGESDTSVAATSQDQNLTQTDKLSQELFSTVTALNQAGTLDQAAVDKISSSIANQIQNSAPRKVYALSDLKITKDDSLKAVQNYNNAMESLSQKYPMKDDVLGILQRLVDENGNIDTSPLPELDPIIKEMGGLEDGMVKLSVPPSLSALHLDIINALERLLENLNDVKMLDSDPVVALSAISQYQNNATAMAEAFNNLGNELQQKLGVQ